MTTLGQLFANNNLVQWWDPKYLTQAFNGKNELGRDFGLPLSTPIASLSSGRVIYSQQMNSDPGSSVGYIVQVQNADGSLFHYQHLRASAVHVGDYVRAGQVLGYSGGCPAAGYGANACRFVDKYSTGPHIEVRYSPTYSKAAGAWGQHWINPAGAFAAYGGQSVTSLAQNIPGTQAISGLLGSAGAGGSLLNVGLDPTQISAGISGGLTSGIQNAFTSFTQAASDAGIRAFLLVGGFLIAGVGLFMLGLDTVNATPPVKRVRGAAAQIGGGAIAGEAGAQAARAIVPPVGDKARAKQLAPHVTEEANRQPQRPALPSPKPAAIKAPTALPALPSGKPADSGYAPGMGDQFAAALGMKNDAEAFKFMRDNPDDPQVKRLHRLAKEAAGVSGARSPLQWGTPPPASAPAPTADITIKAIAPPDLGPLLPKDAQAGAAQRQADNKTRESTRKESARQRRNAARRKKP